MYYKRIEAGLKQRPIEHPDVIGVRSVFSVLQAAKFEERMAREVQRVPAEGAELYSLLSRARLAATDEESGKRVQNLITGAFARPTFLRRHHGRNPSETDRQKLTSMIAESARLGELREWTHHAAMEGANVEALWKSSPGRLALAATAFATREAARKCETTRGVEAFLEHLKALSPAVTPAIEALTAPGVSQRERAAMGRQLLGVYEAVDDGLKRISAQPFSAGTRNSFAQVLEQFRRLADPLLRAAVTGHDHLENRKKEMDTWWTLDLDKPWQPSSEFRVSEAYLLRTTHRFGRATESRPNGEYTSTPQSLADLHTLLHQNVRAAFALITQRFLAPSEFPGPLPQAHALLTEAGCCKNPRHVYSGALALSGISQTSDETRLLYTSPLRDHGLRLSVSHGQAGGLDFVIAFDGGDEESRYTRVTEFFEKMATACNLEGVRKGAQHWPEVETQPRHAIGWHAPIGAGHTQAPETIRAAAILRAILRASITITYFRKPDRALLTAGLKDEKLISAIQAEFWR